jgi:hypothetical protein
MVEFTDAERRYLLEMLDDWLARDRFFMSAQHQALKSARAKIVAEQSSASTAPPASKSAPARPRRRARR